MMASLQVQGDLSKQSVAFSTKYHAFRKKDHSHDKKFLLRS